MGLKIPRDPFSAACPHFFKIKMQDSAIYCNGAGTVAQFDSQLTPAAWMNLAPAFPDSTGAAGALQFGFVVRASLADIYQFAELTALYQQFCILKQEITVSQMCGDSYGGVILPTIYSALDDNDSTAWGSQMEVNQYAGAVTEHIMSANKPFTVSARPKPSTEFYINAVTSGYAVTPGPIWMDTNSYTTPYYSTKFYVRNFINQPNSGMSIRVQPQLWLAFRNPK